MADSSRRHKQVANAIREEIVSIARKDISDPRLSAAGFITFSGVDLTTDMRDATVWVAFMGKDSSDRIVKEALEALTSAAPYIHRLLIKRLPMKVHPKVVFKFDKSFDRAAEIGIALKEAADKEALTAKIRSTSEKTDESEE